MSRLTIMVMGSLAVAGLLALAATSGSAQSVSDDTQPVMGSALADQLGLELVPNQPESCNDYVEVDDPAGYCLDGKVSSVEESFLAGKLLRQTRVTDAEIEFALLHEELSRVASDSDRAHELISSIRLMEQELLDQP